jgi:Sec-independent protein secretion pathway component TatC
LRADERDHGALVPPTGRSFPEVMAVPKYLRYEGGILFACLMARSKEKRQEPQGEDT